MERPQLESSNLLLSHTNIRFELRPQYRHNHNQFHPTYPFQQPIMSQIAVWRGWDRGIVGFRHHGILCPDGTVIHFTDRTRTLSKRHAQIVRTTLEEFRGQKCRDIYDVVYDESELSPLETILKRAEQRLGDQHYNLFFNNCESFAQWCMTGKEESAQIKVYTENAKQGLQKDGVKGALTAIAMSALFMPVVGPKLVKREEASDVAGVTQA